MGGLRTEAFAEEYHFTFDFNSDDKFKGRGFSCLVMGESGKAATELPSTEGTTTGAATEEPSTTEAPTEEPSTTEAPTEGKISCYWQFHSSRSGGSL